MSTTYQKAKSCPQPTGKQKWYHNPQKTKASICFRKQKRDLRYPEPLMTQNRRNPFISGISSLPLCISCQQYYGLDVARGNRIDTRFLCLFANWPPGTYRQIITVLPVCGNISTSWNLVVYFLYVITIVCESFFPI